MHHVDNQAETDIHANCEISDLAHLLSSLLTVISSAEDKSLWTAADVAEFLQVSEATVTKCYACMPNFPRGFRLPSKRGLGSRRWHPHEVRSWCRKQDKY
jgi:predicted DNA-binding transcriptional regulator AlpA